MNQNIEQQLNNMEALVETEDKASELESEAKEFNKTSLSLKWAMCWKNAKWTIILVTTIVIILTVIIVVAVCFMNPDACKSGPSKQTYILYHILSEAMYLYYVFIYHDNT